MRDSCLKQCDRAEEPHVIDPGHRVFIVYIYQSGYGEMLVALKICIDY